MKLLILSCLLGLSLAATPIVPIQKYYHESVGILEAARIKAAEEAQDFDGSRIVGGSAAGLGQYPHMGGLVITLTTGQTSVCGSSLISNTRAVTAAHCWFDGRNQASQFVVVLGSLALFSGGTRVTTSNVIMHEDWDPNRIQFDVAIINLNFVSFSNTIRAIALPSGTQLNNDFVGVTAQAAGFGRQSDWAGIGQNQQLHHVSLRVISNAECQRFFGSTIIASTLCIDGSDRRSTCGGDSGGPLAINQNGQDVLIGITSFGSAFGCTIGFPAGFARVTSFTSWFNARL
ncbi:collagenase-like [Pectinophora gossypiella]|uniref:collagenase-like n=1 Tax=Pectinophora gossypiella TaxID=13191 RepID=UPI00214F442D|nr:collagenase-like [Pectinophora gossypiella]